jgi:hypothetical protein
MNRGYKNNMKFEQIDSSAIVLPPWFGEEEFHKSHRSNLLRKDYEYYSQYFDEPSNLEYLWPV